MTLETIQITECTGSQRKPRLNIYNWLHLYHRCYLIPISLINLINFQRWVWPNHLLCCTSPTINKNSSPHTVPETCCDTRHGRWHQIVEVDVGRVGYLQCPETDVVERLIVDAECLVCMLHQLMYREGSVVWLYYSVWHLQKQTAPYVGPFVSLMYYELGLSVCCPKVKTTHSHFTNYTWFVMCDT